MLVKRMDNMSCCFCCWHYSPIFQKCTYEDGEYFNVNPDDECHIKWADAFDNVCEFEYTEDKQWTGDIGGTLP